jgi:PhnB protein
VAMMKHGEQPGAQDAPAASLKGILYAHMIFGDTEVMASDVAPERFQPMRSVYLSLSVDSSKEAERVHALLAEGGEIFMPMEETFFAFRFSMVRDRFGTSWMIIHQKPMS